MNRNVPKSNLANVIKSEPLKNVLKIQNRVGRRRRVKNRNEPIGELSVDDGLNEIPKRFGAKFMARNLALKFPALAVGVKYSVAKKISENRAREIPLLVNMKLGLQNVLYDGGIGGDDLTVAEEAVEGESGGGGDLEDVGEPLQTAVPIDEKGKEGTHKRV